jgi:hypothetical protein
LKLIEKPVLDYPLLIILVMFWVTLALQGACAPEKADDDVRQPPSQLAPLCHNTIVYEVVVSFT